ncbi:hypothetical protein LP419_40470 [Massilia sp. H-1]|nr:hypothetical protein LP419_40470 [Massilia sp. H-1]
MIDVDQLAAAEKENWVWGGVQCLEPAARRCLVSLTRGGGDAHVVREFDVPSRRFVAEGLRAAGSEGQPGLDRHQPRVCRYRFRAGIDDRIGLSAHRQGMAARHAARQCQHRVRGPRKRHQRQRVEGLHPAP